MPWAALTLVSVAVLLIWDAFPESFPAKSHNVLAAFPLAMIAFAYLVYQAANRSPLGQWAKAIIGDVPGEEEEVGSCCAERSFLKLKLVLNLHFNSGEYSRND